MRVAVAAAGATTCLAGSADSTWRKVRAGESGLGPLTLFDPGSTGRSGTVGEVAGHAGLTGGPRLAALAEAALTEALAEAEAAGVDRTELTGAWVTVGVSLGDIFEQSGPDVELDHFWGVVAARLGLTGPVVVLSSACSSGTDAVGYGADLVASGIAPVVVAVGVDSLEPGKYTGHSGLKTMSPDRCRPYDADGDGTTLAEGACALVLTDADRLPGTPLAELRGWAASTDIDALTSPDLSGEGAARMLRTALERAAAPRPTSPTSTGTAPARPSTTSWRPPCTRRSSLSGTSLSPAPRAPSATRWARPARWRRCSPRTRCVSGSPRRPRACASRTPAGPARPSPPASGRCRCPRAAPSA
ncbi:hypothetical protein GCM10020256_34580 [Streptomyces thermocoprophilus]